MGASYSFEKIPSLTGKTIIITGSNTGIGKVCALEFARKGAQVILACRNRERAIPVVEEIIKETGNSKVEFMELNVSSLASVVKFTNEFRAKNLPLHVLLNNAGIMATPFSLSEDGIESQFATNHLGHFLLTLRLLDLLEASSPSRVVNVSSYAHTFTFPEGVRCEKLNEEESYEPWTTYGHTKLCNILFTKALARRLNDKLVFVNAVHPGFVNTELSRGPKEYYNNYWADMIGTVITNIGAKTPQDGALTSIFACVAPEIEEKKANGLYFIPTAQYAEPSAFAQDEALQEKLWTFSENLVKEKLGPNALDPTWSN